MRMTSIAKYLAALYSLIIVSALSGCIVHSVNSCYSKDSVVEMPALYGKWLLKESSIEDGRDQEWTFTSDKITLPDFKGSAATLVTRFFRIDDMLFLDAIADSPPEVLSFWWVAHVAPMHTVSRVIVGDGTMKIIPLNASWMEEAVKNRTVTLPSVWHEDQKSYLFTASPSEWAEFLKKYGKDKKAFPDSDAMVFTRKP